MALESVGLSLHFKQLYLFLTRKQYPTCRSPVTEVPIVHYHHRHTHTHTHNPKGVMGSASVVHNGIQMPLFNFDHRVSHSPSPSKCSALHFVHHPISSFFSGLCSILYVETYPLSCAKFNNT